MSKRNVLAIVVTALAMITCLQAESSWFTILALFLLLGLLVEFWRWVPKIEQLDPQASWVPAAVWLGIVTPISVWLALPDGGRDLLAALFPALLGVSNLWDYFNAKRNGRRVQPWERAEANEDSVSARD